MNNDDTLHYWQTAIRAEAAKGFDVAERSFFVLQLHAPPSLHVDGYQYASGMSKALELAHLVLLPAEAIDRLESGIRTRLREVAILEAALQRLKAVAP